MGTIKWEMFSVTEFPPSKREEDSGVGLYRGLESKVWAQGEEIAQSQTHPGKSSQNSHCGVQPTSSRGAHCSQFFLQSPNRLLFLQLSTRLSAWLALSVHVARKHFSLNTGITLNDARCSRGRGSGRLPSPCTPGLSMACSGQTYL